MSAIPEAHEAVGQLAADAPLTSFKLPTPKPGRDKVLVRVLWAAGTSITVWLIDFKLPPPTYPYVPGENIAGEVVAVGEGVDYKVGDRILSFNFPDEASGKASQEYALLSKWSVSKLPDNVSFQDAATIPDNLVTAYFTLFDRLGIPEPSTFPATFAPEDASAPILVWGAGSSVGQYAVQLLHLAGYQKVFAVASSRHHEYLRSLGANVTFDYSFPDVVKQILAEAGGHIKFALDAIGDEDNSLKPISQLVGGDSRVAYLLPVRIGKHGAVGGVKSLTNVPFPDGAKLVAVGTKWYQEVNEHLKRNLQPNIIPELLGKGLIKPNRVKEITGDTLLERVSKSVELLRQGKVRGERLVFKVTAE